MNNRTARLLPGGEPKYVRVYDNGGGFFRFCRRCFTFNDPELCPTCGKKSVAAPKGSFDRYTVVFTGRYRRGADDRFIYLAMSTRPTHPQGFGQRGDSRVPIDTPSGGFPPAMGSLSSFGARRIPFSVLPQECKDCALGDYKAIWNLND